MISTENLKAQNKKMLDVLKELYEDYMSTDINRRFLTHGEKIDMIKKIIMEVE